MVNGLELAIWSKSDGGEATAILEGAFVDSLHGSRDSDFGQEHQIHKGISA